MKAKRFLISIERKEAIAPRKAYQRGYPTISELTHTRHITVTSHNPEQIAIDYAQAHKSEVISVAPVKKNKRKSCLVSIPRKSDDQWEQTAIAYAMWLANRDGITLPSYNEKPRAVWSGVYSKTRTRTPAARSWNPSPKPQAIYERRICAVEWGHKEERYNSRKDGRRGAWTHNEFVPCLRIEIPNWDWQPAEPVETIDDDQPQLLAA